MEPPRLVLRLVLRLRNGRALRVLPIPTIREYHIWIRMIIHITGMINKLVRLNTRTAPFRTTGDF